ncbi:MAG: hypothetical protein PUB66_04575 [Oscillospiraceae bacterium]|nr:hypothetical protein [Oscillospiraceae bacterium]
MAVNYISQKCTSCAGTRFEYLKDQKMWKCLYCGTLIERHEQADSMFTIKNVVRQSILDDAWMRFDSAQKNLVECEKIDSRYIGTIIAEIAYEVNMMFYGGLNKQQQSNMFAQMKKNYASLRNIAASPNDEEIALYEFFESSETVGALILVFDALKDSARVELLFNYFDPKEVYSADLNSKLLKYAIKQKNYDLFDSIIKNSENIDKKSIFRIILNNYPDTPAKAENIRLITENGDFLSEDEQKLMESYLRDTQDCADTKYAAAEAVLQTPACPGVDVLFENVAAELEDSSRIQQLIGIILDKDLLDTELYKIVDFALSRCSGESCLQVFEKLASSENFVTLNYDHLMKLLKNKEIDIENKKKIFEIAVQCHVSDKIVDKCISSYLSEIQDTPENREELIPFLLGSVKTFSSPSAERYIMSTGIDGSKKAEYAEMILDKGVNTSVFRNTLNQYLTGTQDSYNVKYDMICLLKSKGINASLDTAIAFLENAEYQSDQKISIINKLKENAFTDNDIYNTYVEKVDATKFDSEVHAALISSATVISENAFVRYVLWLSDLPAAKAGYVSKMTGMCAARPNDIQCSFMLNGSKIESGLVQAYIFTAREDTGAAASVLEALGDIRSCCKSEMRVNGSKTNLVKFVRSQKNTLSQKQHDLCKICGAL